MCLPVGGDVALLDPLSSCICAPGPCLVPHSPGLHLCLSASSRAPGLSFIWAARALEKQQGLAPPGRGQEELLLLHQSSLENAQRSVQGTGQGWAMATTGGE